MRDYCQAAVLAGLLAAGAAAAAHAQLAISANDAKVKLINGKVEVQKNPPSDTLTFIDLGSNPPKVLAELDVSNSVVGPPTNVAITPKEEIALVSSNMVIDPADPTKQTADDKVAVIDLGPLRPGVVGRLKSAVGVKGSPAAPAVLARVQTGKGPAGIAINKAGTLALVANREEGTVSILTISGKTVTAAGKVKVGDEKSMPSGIVIAPDGKSALVTRYGDHRVAMLTIDGTKVELSKREFAAGLRPYGIDIAKGGDVAVVANVGMGLGDADTISVIDLKAEPPRVVNSYSVGQTPEGVKLSPDGKFVAVTVMNGTNKPLDSPFFNASSLLQVWTRTGTQLAKVGELPIGKWCQGIAWSSNSKTLLVQCMVEEEITVVRFSGLGGRSLQKVGTIKTKGGPAGIRTAEP